MITYKSVIPRNDITNGYQYFMDKAHPLCHKDGKVYYHRHVASLKVGRWLTAEDHVHHKDHNRANNDPGNLLILTASEHSKLHKPVELEVKVCKKCGKTYTPDKAQRIYCSKKCDENSRRKTARPSKNKLISEIDQLGYKGTGRKYGVSDNAIRKWLKNY